MPDVRKERHMTPSEREQVATAAYAERGTMINVLIEQDIPLHAHEDLIQEVVLGAVRSAERGRLAWQEQPALRAWLAVATKRAALRYVLKARKEPKAERVELSVEPFESTR